jgi:hypothetical protein
LGFDRDDNYRLLGVIGVNSGGFFQWSLTPRSLNLNFDFTLPTGENGLIKKGRSAASAGFNFLNFQDLIAFIENRKYMFQEPTFGYLFKIIRLLF